MKLSTKRRKKEKSKLAVVEGRRKRRSKHLFRRRFESKKAHSNQPTVWTTTEKYADFGMRWKRLYVLCSRLGHQARGPTLALLRSLPQRCHFNSVCHQVLRKFIDLLTRPKVTAEGAHRRLSPPPGRQLVHSRHPGPVREREPRIIHHSQEHPHARHRLGMGRTTRTIGTTPTPACHRYHRFPSTIDRCRWFRSLVAYPPLLV